MSRLDESICRAVEIRKTKLDVDKRTLLAAADNDAEKAKHGHKLILTGKSNAMRRHLKRRMLS